MNVNEEALDILRRGAAQRSLETGPIRGNASLVRTTLDVVRGYLDSTNAFLELLDEAADALDALALRLESDDVE